uniref:zinc finger and SCAN domain-containing protein 12-like n=1 Tax=Euleptes europaea TaxID=460621 RepID=UPI0025405006|nr:zinc finger and SCAN domain-containing protein 12-like [Euleptes europaea]
MVLRSDSSGFQRQKRKVMEQNSAGPKGRAEEAIWIEDVAEQPRGRVRQEGREEPAKGLHQRWEAQWQDFLRALESPHTGSEKEPSPWEDAKAFLASFEQVAKACQWPREEWAARLLPALSGEAQQAFGSLEARDREDYGKVRAAILCWEANRMETLRQHFRQLRFQEVEDPRRIYSQLQELCRQWLRPESHSKEQILELLILEQFLAILPLELQSWIRASGPENCTQATALVDDFLLSKQRGAETRKWQKVRLGALVAEGESWDPKQRPIAKDAKQTADGETTLLGHGTKNMSLPSLLLSPEAQEVVKEELTEAQMDCEEMGVSLHIVEETQPGQKTMFWQVLPGDGGKVYPLGDKKGSQFKVVNPSHRGIKPGDPKMTQEDTLVMVEIHEERCKPKRRMRKQQLRGEYESRENFSASSNRIHTANTNNRMPLVSSRK